VSVDAPVSLLDVAPTLLSLAGARPLPSAAGRSLEPFLLPDGDASKWPNEVFAETYVRHPQQRPARMVRRGRWKLVLYEGHEAPQLFDVEADPGESRDLGASPDHADLRRELLARVRESWRPARIEQTVAGRQMVRSWRRQIKVGASEVWTMPPGCNVFPER
jgi:choline-sulfatase